MFLNSLEEMSSASKMEEEGEFIERVIDHRESARKDADGKEFPVTEFLIKWRVT